nr:hypothetical protein Iba_chr14dCG2410 [Ipomoea batatas]
MPAPENVTELKIKERTTEMEKGYFIILFCLQRRCLYTKENKEREGNDVYNQILKHEGKWRVQKSLGDRILKHGGVELGRLLEILGGLEIAWVSRELSSRPPRWS